MAKVKKIVFTVTNDITYDQRMNRISNTLCEAGYQVTIIGFMKKRSVKTVAKPYHQVRFKMLFKKGKLFYFAYNFRLFWYLLFQKFDIYCGIDLDTLLPIYLVGKLKGKPIVYDAHEYFTELPEIVNRPLIKQSWLFLEKSLLPNIKNNYTVGGQIAQILSKKYGQPFEVIRNVPLLNEATQKLRQEPYILYQGALNVGRGLEPLMQAMSAIDINLYIAGEGDLSNELRQFAGSLPHHNKIRFLGYLRPDELKTFTANATIGVNLVEHLGLSYYYSLSNKYFDYIHAGIPQITMAFPEYLQLNDQFNTAILIEDLEPISISNAINQLLNDKALYLKLQEQTVLAKQVLNWQAESLKLIKFYSKIE